MVGDGLLERVVTKLAVLGIQRTMSWKVVCVDDTRSNVSCPEKIVPVLEKLARLISSR
jgi:hypothetical protein